MPAVSRSQQRAMAMAEHATPEELEKAGPAVKEMAGSMSTDQLHDFASGSMAGKPEHVHHRKHHEHPKTHRGDGRSAGRDKKARGDYTK